MVARDRVLSLCKLIGPFLYAKLNCLNRTLWTLNCIDKKKLYLYLTELFEIELFICINMDLALNNLQMLICHKTKTNIQTNGVLAHSKIIYPTKNFLYKSYTYLIYGLAGVGIK